jgi:hypothetical protein
MPIGRQSNASEPALCAAQAKPTICERWIREGAMNFFEDKRVWYGIAALIVLAILIVMLRPHNQTAQTPAPATSSLPATTPEPSPTPAPK